MDKFVQQGNTENAWYKYEVDYKAKSPLMVLWHMIMFFPIIICVAITSLVMLIGWGPKRVRRLWDETMRDQD